MTYLFGEIYTNGSPFNIATLRTVQPEESIQEKIKRDMTSIDSYIVWKTEADFPQIDIATLITVAQDMRQSGDYSREVTLDIGAAVIKKATEGKSGAYLSTRYEITAETLKGPANIELLIREAKSPDVKLN